MFDASGHQIGGGKWIAKQEVAWVLTGLADLPEDEAKMIAAVLAEFPKRS
jgi:hypothetical protein